MAAAATLGVVAAFGGCAAIVATADGCGFDPPPGDFGLVHVLNDGDQSVNLFLCNDQTCTSGTDPQSVPAGHELTVNYELCNGDSMGLTNTDGALVGCVSLPVGESVTEHTYRASQFDRACAAAGDVHPRIN